MFRPFLISLALAIVASCAPVPGVDLDRPPQTVMATQPLEVGQTYTVGSPASSEVPRPITITDVEVLHLVGLVVVGIGALDVESAGVGLSMVLGWPPADVAVPIVDPRSGDATFAGLPLALVGLRTTAVVSGLRGVRVSWIDADGRPGSRVWDLAIVTCSPGMCPSGDAETEEILRDLGLLR